MEFWLGLIIGTFGGANIGIVIAGLLATAKREETGQGYSWDQPHMDKAVTDETRRKLGDLSVNCRVLPWNANLNS